MLRRLSPAGTLLRVAAVATLALAAACMGAPYPTGTLEQLYPQPPRPVPRQYTVDGRVIHYLEAAGEAGAAAVRVLLIHGTPGSWEAWSGYLGDRALLAQAHLVAMDRPGFGATGGDVVAQLPAQARLLAPLLQGPGAPAIVVGHSLGGPIAAQLAMDYPEQVRGVLMIAPSVAPEYERPRWYNELMDWRLVQWLAPQEWVNSNRELMPLAAELQVMDGRWAGVRAPVWTIQGGVDTLVDPRTADYVAAKLAAPQHRLIRLPDQGHFVLWDDPALVTGALLQLIEATAGAGT